MEEFIEIHNTNDKDQLNTLYSEFLEQSANLKDIIFKRKFDELKAHAQEEMAI